MGIYVFRTGDGQTVHYVSPDALVVGDYGGAGTVGEANLRELMDRIKEENVSHCDYYGDFMYDQRTGDYEAFTDEFGETYSTPDIAPTVIICHQLHSTRFALLKEGDSFTKELLEELEQYPLLNEGWLCEVETEWANEAAEELIDELAWELADDGVDEGKLRHIVEEAVYDAMQAHWDHVHFEHSSAYLDEVIQDAAREKVRAALAST